MTNYPPGVSASTPEAPWNQGFKNQAQEDMWDDLLNLRGALLDLEDVEDQLGEVAQVQVYPDPLWNVTECLAAVRQAIQEKAEALAEKLGVEDAV